MPSVPTWIPRAVIFRPTLTGGHVLGTVAEWRATKTQVIVRTSPIGAERRFRLDTLTEVGDQMYGSQRTRLASPSDPEVIRAQQEKIVSNALASVSSVLTAQRLQDSRQTPEQAAAKLTAVADAVNAALAEIGKVL